MLAMPSQYAEDNLDYKMNSAKDSLLVSLTLFISNLLNAITKALSAGTSRAGGRIKGCQTNPAFQCVLS